MNLLQQVQVLSARLAPLGWGALLLRHGLDLGASDLEAELARPLPGIDREGVPGFADFHADATRGVEPGNPAQSLLYHALASPAVHPTPNGLPAPNPAAYPTLEELDALENYIYARQQLALNAAELARLRVVVFAYQYRTAARTGHGLYADLTYSRTGIARVGTSPAHYDPRRRSFWPVPANGRARQDIAAMGARYGAFLAVQRQLSPREVLVGGLANDADAGRRFWIPRHKLFAGPECLPGLHLTLEYGEFHLNEKLRRIHLASVPGAIKPLPGFNIDQPPFVRSSKSGTTFVELQSAGSSLLVLPVVSGRLVELAIQRRSTTNTDEIVRYKVPKAIVHHPPQPEDNRYGLASFKITARTGVRLAPEYVNMRHEVVADATGKLRVDDLNAWSKDDYEEKLNDGDYEAAHFLDNSADGCVGVKVAGLPHDMADPVAAYSLVTAPDFLPLVDQTTIFTWATQLQNGQRTHFAQGSPNPLSRGRWAANPAILRPDTTSAAFDPADETMTAVLNHRQLGPRTSQLAAPPTVADEAVSYLPDAGANVFAPGWDVSLSSDEQSGVFFMTSLGLGSPFPEDAKLCAALNSFWPAAAPDASRTFGITTLAPTAQPLLDTELGYHPRHRLVQSNTVAARPGWDGEFGPFLEQLDQGLFVNYADLDRSDYVSNTLAGLLHLDDLSRITAEEMIARMEALRACIRQLPGSGDMVSTTRLFLVEAEAIADWATVATRFDGRLTGSGYRYVFVDMDAEIQKDPSDQRRQRRKVKRRFECQLAMQGRKATLLVYDDDAIRQPTVVNP
ncbi:hypothetical protein [Hymenobacter cellulosilyticus]|uniref:Uncharacterized protein n=1 Tax=Hymenobacter cellulosilyticus TaxID=2932248 RepID=A0A8T9Q780_9BACT|nr:hypothetical protein [Hymenobacter cellulosilyticus]UOQ71630.1 hypothetical protein MUN79_23945 [Hymenobacter cellulosilyticus]